MKTLRKLIAITVLAVLATGCTSAFYASSGYASDDLYAMHNKVEIARKKQAEAEAQKAAAEARKAEWEARIAEAQASAAEDDYYNSRSSNPYQDVLADDYESAYARRLRGFESPTYNMPSSYYNFRYGSSINYVSAYDPAFYNVMVMGDQVWVEPKYITSMFGSWGRPSIYSNAWYFGWGYTPSYAYWGYPSFGWGGWNFGLSWYDPWYCGWGGGWGHHNHCWNGYYPGYYPGWGHGGHGSSHRPYTSNIVHRANANRSPSGTYYGAGNRGNSGASSLRGNGNSNRNFGVRSGSSSGNRNNSGSSIRNNRYNSGSSNSNYNNSSTYRNSGGNSYNRGNSYDSGSSSSYNRGSSSNSSYSGSSGSSSRGSSGTSSSGGSYRNAGGR